MIDCTKKASHGEAFLSFRVGFFTSDPVHPASRRVPSLRVASLRSHRCSKQPGQSRLISSIDCFGRGVFG
jgi:hypothetical protein